VLGQLLSRHPKLDHQPLFALFIDKKMAMEEDAAVFLKVCARDGFAPGMFGIEGRGPQHDVPTVEGAVALANRHCGLVRVVPHGREAIRFGIETGDSGAGGFRSVSIREGEIRLEKLPVWIMYCLHVPFVTIGFPFIGKKVLTTSQSPANCPSNF
jgi:hypothetical protein